MTPGSIMQRLSNEEVWKSLSVTERLKFLSIANFDFLHADRAMVLALEIADDPSVLTISEDERYIAYADAAIVRYCRPFFETRIGAVKLRLPDTYLKVLNESERALHDAAIDLRKRVVAHSDNDYKRVDLERVAIDQESSGWVVVLGYHVFDPRQLVDLQFVKDKIAVAVRVDVDAFANRLFPNSEIGTKRFIE